MRISDWSSDVCSSDLLSREDVISEIFLTVKAGSSGRPNKAAEIANRERALPFIVQLPGSAGVANAMLTDYLDLLDIDHGDAVLDGLRSEERRVGKECVSKCSSRWWPSH